MFTGISAIAAFQNSSDPTPRKIPPPTPLRFPQCRPQTDKKRTSSSRGGRPLVALLQSTHRPGDINISLFEALGLHVISNASPQQLIPDESFLPPVEEWNAIAADDLLEANDATKRPLNNGNLSPGVQTFRERQNELLIDNIAAFRTIRRIPPPTGETAVRLGNAYEFFKNLELFSAYWEDTSLSPKSSSPTSAETEEETPIPLHLQTHHRSGTGTQLPPEYRQNLLTAFIKLVAYDFGCNVSFPRCEPRLHLTPPPSSSRSTPTSSPSYFNSSVTFIYRTPTERPAARAGIVEGPVAAISCRATTVFATEVESQLDLAREVIAVLLTAQQRAREGKTEKRFGEGKWWTSKPRWGGGPGGPIGREAEKAPGDVVSFSAENSSSNPNPNPTILTGGAATKVPTETDEKFSPITTEAKRAIGGIIPPVPVPLTSKRPKRGRGENGGTLQIYDIYRKLLPPSSTWDRKARYCAIGKTPSSDSGKSGEEFDDIFLLSSLNHHVSIVRVKVPVRLLEVLEGGEGEWERVVMWRSKWYDLFRGEERVEAMMVIWGMIAWLMRKIELPVKKEVGAECVEGGGEGKRGKESVDEGEKMDLS